MLSGLVAGIFVGGKSRRMGEPKGLLRAPDADETLVGRLARICEESGRFEQIVLVGARPEYAGLPWLALPDAMENSGPLGGLVSLLEFCVATHRRAAVVLACDLPFLRGSFVERLASEAPDADLLAPRRSGFWEPLSARYGSELASAARRSLEARELSLQRFLEGRAQELAIGAAEESDLTDWDSPEDRVR